MIHSKRSIRTPQGEIPPLSASRRFGGYKKETPKRTRESDVTEDHSLDKLIRIWKRFTNGERYAQENYPEAYELAGKISYSSEDITRFCITMAQFQGESNFFENKAGTFLSALINNGNEGKYMIPTEHFDMEIHWLGLANSKDVTVVGDVGIYSGVFMRSGNIEIRGNVGRGVGSGMKSGNIIVKGDAECYVGSGWHSGSMRGGLIIVEGNAGADAGRSITGGEIRINGDVGDSPGKLMRDGLITIDGNAGRTAGSQMKGGKLLIRGNAGKLLGNLMEGGEIHLEGGYESLGEVKGGRIYHKGKLIAGQ
jgi:formylmethanofuran dehydrogenase subunit C